jgi:hypothetical protein
MANFETEITVNVMDVYDDLTLSEQVDFVKTAIDNMNPTFQKEIFGYFLDYIKELYDLTEIEEEE